MQLRPDGASALCCTASQLSETCAGGRGPAGCEALDERPSVE